MTQGKDSVFVGITDHVGCQRVLMVRRRHGDTWWLPGGAIPLYTTEVSVARDWLKELFSVNVSIFDADVGPWKLSNGAQVHLCGGTIDSIHFLDDMEMCIHDGSENKHITEVAAMSTEDIYHHLYMARDMLWLQVRLALWAMYPQSLASKLGDQHDQPLMDDIGWFKGYKWTRPH